MWVSPSFWQLGSQDLRQVRQSSLLALSTHVAESPWLSSIVGAKPTSTAPSLLLMWLAGDVGGRRDTTPAYNVHHKSQT